MISAEMLHYGAAGLALCISAVGCGIGLGIAGQGMVESSLRQPMATAPIFSTMVIGLAILESGAIITLVATLMVLFGKPVDLTDAQALAAAGGVLAVGVVSMTASIASGFIARATAQAIARVPIFAGKFSTFMVITQSLIEAPIIFALIVNLMVRTHITPTMSWELAVTLFAASCCIMIGCIGPSVGQSIFAHAAVTAVGENYKAYSKFFTFSLVNYAFIETAVIFCLIISLCTIFILPGAAATGLTALRACVAATTISLGSLGGAIALGLMGKKSCEGMALDVAGYASIARLTLISGVFIESTIIYAFLIALLLISG